MQLTAVVAPRSVTRLVREFRRALRSEVHPTRKVGNPSSTSECQVHVHWTHDFWVVLGDIEGASQTWHVFGVLDQAFDRPSATLGHVCQVNFSYGGYSSQVAGLFAKDSKDRVYVTHSGRVGGGKPGVGKDAFLAYVAEHAPRLRAADIEVDGESTTTRLLVAELNSPRFRSQIADFVHLVAKFKAHVDGRDWVEDDAPSGSTSSGQGYEADPAVRRAVEEHAMQVAEQHYRSLGCSIERVHRRRGELDLRCTRRGREFRVEVKGTSGEGGAVELTSAEYKRATSDPAQVHLAVVNNISVDRSQDPPTATGGTLVVYENFDPDQHEPTPTRYRCQLDPRRQKRR